jgi:hypothetical protein
MRKFRFDPYRRHVLVHVPVELVSRGVHHIPGSIHRELNPGVGVVAAIRTCFPTVQLNPTLYDMSILEPHLIDTPHA